MKNLFRITSKPTNLSHILKKILDLGFSYLISILEQHTWEDIAANLLTELKD